MSWLKRLYPFNAEQTVNIASGVAPLVAPFVVNAITGSVEDGTWALIVTTGMAIIAMLVVLKRLPIFPLIASSVTVVFGILTLITHNPFWVQFKVTIFNAMFALFLFVGLYLKKNFFKYIFEKTFHYTQKGWDQFTWSFAWFLRGDGCRERGGAHHLRSGQHLYAARIYDGRGQRLDPVQGRNHHAGERAYTWLLTRIMAKHALPIPDRKEARLRPPAASPWRLQLGYGCDAGGLIFQTDCSGSVVDRFVVRHPRHCARGQSRADFRVQLGR